MLCSLTRQFCLLQVHTYRAKPPPAMPDILKCVLELMLAMSDSADVRQMHAKVRGRRQHLKLCPLLNPGCCSRDVCFIPALRIVAPLTASRILCGAWGMRVPHAGCSLKLRLLLLLVQCCLVTGRLAGCRSAIAWEIFRGSGSSWSTSPRAPPGRALSPWRSSTANKSSPGSTPGLVVLISVQHDDMMHLTAGTYMQLWSQASPTHAFSLNYSKPKFACEHTGVCLISKCGASSSLGLCSLLSSTRHCGHVKLGLHTPLNSAFHDSPMTRLAIRALCRWRPPA